MPGGRRRNRWTSVALRPYNPPMIGLPFTKMHGLGNDFVLFDTRRAPRMLDGAFMRAVADRRTGVGCDQVIVLEPPRSGGTDAYMRIWNQDGGEVAACGNGTRCAARLLLDESRRSRVVLETAAGPLTAHESGEGRIRVDMGPARLEWRDIPLARPADTLHVAISAGPLGDAVAVNVGNPHAVFFVDDADAVPLDALGPRIETDPLFPERANIGVAQRLACDRIRLRVWERGAGLTRACGTGACAATVAGARRGLTGRSVAVVLDGGELGIVWRTDGRVEMTGACATSFTGVLPA